MGAIYFYIYYKCTFGCCYLIWGQRSPAGPKGPFQPSAGARKRMAVGHPNFLLDTKSHCIMFITAYLQYFQIVLESALAVAPPLLWSCLSVLSVCPVCLSCLSVSVSLSLSLCLCL